MQPGGAVGASPSVCPFVALADDRDRRADGPDGHNRCYAEAAPRRRDAGYQAAYCYSARFSTCGTFLSWAARNAAEPAYAVPSTAAREDPGSSARGHATGGIAGREDTAVTVDAAGQPGEPDVDGDAQLGAAAAEDVAGRSAGGSELLDWVSASAWAEVPAREHAGEDLGELPLVADEPGPAARDQAPAETGADGEAAVHGGSTTAPKVPAALPMRRRRRPQEPIRTRGSGEWHYSDPPDRQPLVRRRWAVAPPVALGALGLIVVAMVVFLLSSLLSGGGPDGDDAALAPSRQPGASGRPLTTPRAAARTPAVSESPATPAPSPRIRTYRVRSGDTLSSIAARFGVSIQLLQCRNYIRNANRIAVGQVLTIPPDGFSCPAGWRRATPTPAPLADE